MATGASGDFVSQFGGSLVLFIRHRFGELLGQRRSDVVLVAKRFFQFDQLPHEFVLVELLLGLHGRKHVVHALQSAIDFLDSPLRPGRLEGLECGRLGAVEEDERPILLVREAPLRIGRVLGGEIHQRQGMVRIANGPAELLKCQPADPSMIELQKLAIYLEALLFGQFE